MRLGSTRALLAEKKKYKGGKDIRLQYRNLCKEKLEGVRQEDCESVHLQQRLDTTSEEPLGEGCAVEDLHLSFQQTCLYVPVKLHWMHLQQVKFSA